MKKKVLILSILVVSSFSVLFNSCTKDENTIATNESGQVTSHYVLDGIDYPVVMKQKDDGTFDVISIIDEKLIEVLDLPTSTLLQDPFYKNTYHVFRTENESKTQSAEIVKQMNQFESKFGKINQQSSLKSGGIAGSIFLFWDRYFVNLDSVRPSLTSDWGYPSLGSFNDKMSSYKVWSNTTGERTDGKRYVIRFYENSNYGGHVLTAYGFFVNWNGNDYQVSWQDQNMHGTLMVGGIIGRKYWGDQVSSIRWSLE